MQRFLGEHLALLKQGKSFSGYERSKVWLNRGNGKYMDISGVSGADTIADGRAAVFWDFDDDGDEDIFLRAMHGRAHYLFRNEVGHKANWLRVSLQGTKSGRDAFGAVVRVKTPNGIQTKIKSGGAGFLAQHDPRLLFGLGKATTVEWIEVTWPSGKKQRQAGAPARTHVRIAER